MIENSAEYNQLTYDSNYQNLFKQNYLNVLNYSTMNNIIYMNMKMKSNLYQLYQYNDLNYHQNLSFNGNTKDILKKNLNKFNYSFGKNLLPNERFGESGSNEKNEFNFEKTFLKKTEKKNKKEKKYSMDSTKSGNCSEETADTEEKDEKNEKIIIETIEDQKNNDNFKNKKDSFNKAECNKKYSFTDENSNSLDSSAFIIKEKAFLEEKNNNSQKSDNKICSAQNHKINPAFENTEILNVKVKLSNNRTAIFKLKRYDDLFLTIKLFCEINCIEEKLIKPLIIKSLATINTIYQMMNCQLEEKQINVLKKIRNL
jgi:hypothetical protein